MNQLSTFNQVKLYNVNLIKNALRSLPSATKHLLSQMTGLSVTTCSTIVNELLETGEILPADADPSFVGRPPKAFSFNKDFAYICCLFPTFENGGLALHYAIVDLLGNVIRQEVLHQQYVSCEDIAALIQKLVAEEPRIQYLSLGIPGYNLNDQIESSSIKELEGQNLSGFLKETFHIPVFIENDTNVVTYGSYAKHIDTLDDNSGFVAIASFQNLRLGAGVVLNGKIVHGYTNFAGEIFYLSHTKNEVHTIVFPDLREATIDLVSEALKSYCVALNPSTVVLTGEEISEDMLDIIRSRCLKNIPSKHMPQLIYEENYIDSFVGGLTQIVLDEIF